MHDNVFTNYQDLLNDIISDDHLTDMQKNIFRIFSYQSYLDINIYSDHEIINLRNHLKPRANVKNLEWLFALVSIRDMFYFKNFIIGRQSPKHYNLFTSKVGKQLIVTTIKSLKKI